MDIQWIVFILLISLTFGAKRKGPETSRTSTKPKTPKGKFLDAIFPENLTSPELQKKIQTLKESIKKRNKPLSSKDFENFNKLSEILLSIIEYEKLFKNFRIFEKGSDKEELYNRVLKFILDEMKGFTRSIKGENLSTLGILENVKKKFESLIDLNYHYKTIQEANTLIKDIGIDLFESVVLKFLKDTELENNKNQLVENLGFLNSQLKKHVDLLNLHTHKLVQLLKEFDEIIKISEFFHFKIEKPLKIDSIEALQLFIEKEKEKATKFILSKIKKSKEITKKDLENISTIITFKKGGNFLIDGINDTINSGDGDSLTNLFERMKSIEDIKELTKCAHLIVKLNQSIPKYKDKDIGDKFNSFLSSNAKPKKVFENCQRDFEFMINDAIEQENHFIKEPFKCYKEGELDHFSKNKSNWTMDLNEELSDKYTKCTKYLNEMSQKEILVLGKKSKLLTEAHELLIKNVVYLRRSKDFQSGIKILKEGMKTIELLQFKEENSKISNMKESNELVKSFKIFKTGILEGFKPGKYFSVQFASRLYDVEDLILRIIVKNDLKTGKILNETLNNIMKNPSEISMSSQIDNLIFRGKLALIEGNISIPSVEKFDISTQFIEVDKRLKNRRINQLKLDQIREIQAKLLTLGLNMEDSFQKNIHDKLLKELEFYSQNEKLNLEALEAMKMHFAREIEKIKKFLVISKKTDLKILNNLKEFSILKTFEDDRNIVFDSDRSKDLMENYEHLQKLNNLLQDLNFLKNPKISILVKELKKENKFEAFKLLLNNLQKELDFQSNIESINHEKLRLIESEISALVNLIYKDSNPEQFQKELINILNDNRFQENRLEALRAVYSQLNIFLESRKHFKIIDKFKPLIECIKNVELRLVWDKKLIGKDYIEFIQKIGSYEDLFKDIENSSVELPKVNEFYENLCKEGNPFNLLQHIMELSLLYKTSFVPSFDSFKITKSFNDQIQTFENFSNEMDKNLEMRKQTDMKLQLKDRISKLDHIFKESSFPFPLDNLVNLKKRLDEEKEKINILNEAKALESIKVEFGEIQNIDKFVKSTLAHLKSSTESIEKRFAAVNLEISRLIVESENQIDKQIKKMEINMKDEHGLIKEAINSQISILKEAKKDKFKFSSISDKLKYFGDLSKTMKNVSNSNIEINNLKSKIEHIPQEHVHKIMKEFQEMGKGKGEGLSHLNQVGKLNQKLLDIYNIKKENIKKLDGLSNRANSLASLITKFSGNNNEIENFRKFKKEIENFKSSEESNPHEKNDQITTSLGSFEDEMKKLEAFVIKKVMENRTVLMKKYENLCLIPSFQSLQHTNLERRILKIPKKMESIEIHNIDSINSEIETLISLIDKRKLELTLEPFKNISFKERNLEFEATERIIEDMDLKSQIEIKKTNNQLALKRRIKLLPPYQLDKNVHSPINVSSIPKVTLSIHIYKVRKATFNPSPPFDIGKSFNIVRNVLQSTRQDLNLKVNIQNLKAKMLKYDHNMFVQKIHDQFQKLVIDIDHDKMQTMLIGQVYNIRKMSDFPLPSSIDNNHLITRLRLNLSKRQKTEFPPLIIKSFNDIHKKYRKIKRSLKRQFELSKLTLNKRILAEKIETFGLLSLFEGKSFDLVFDSLENQKVSLLMSQIGKIVNFIPVTPFEGIKTSFDRVKNILKEQREIIDLNENRENLSTNIKAFQTISFIKDQEIFNDPLVQINSLERQAILNDQIREIDDRITFPQSTLLNIKNEFLSTHLKLNLSKIQMKEFPFSQFHFHSFSLEINKNCERMRAEFFKVKLDESERNFLSKIEKYRPISFHDEKIDFDHYLDNLKIQQFSLLMSHIGKIMMEAFPPSILSKIQSIILKVKNTLQKERENIEKRHEQLIQKISDNKRIFEYQIDDNQFNGNLLSLQIVNLRNILLLKGKIDSLIEREFEQKGDMTQIIDPIQYQKARMRLNGSQAEYNLFKKIMDLRGNQFESNYNLGDIPGLIFNFKDSMKHFHLVHKIDLIGGKSHMPPVSLSHGSIGGKGAFDAISKTLKRKNFKLEFMDRIKRFKNFEFKDFQLKDSIMNFSFKRVKDLLSLQKETINNQKIFYEKIKAWKAFPFPHFSNSTFSNIQIQFERVRKKLKKKLNELLEDAERGKRIERIEKGKKILIERLLYLRDNSRIPLEILIATYLRIVHFNGMSLWNL